MKRQRCVAGEGGGEGYSPLLRADGGENPVLFYLINNLGPDNDKPCPILFNKQPRTRHSHNPVLFYFINNLGPDNDTTLSYST